MKAAERADKRIGGARAAAEAAAALEGCAPKQQAEGTGRHAPLVRPSDAVIVLLRTPLRALSGPLLSLFYASRSTLTLPHTSPE